MTDTNFNSISCSTSQFSAEKPFTVKSGDNLKQNTPATTLTDKIVRICQAIYLSTWFSDVPVEMGTLCVSKVLQGEVWRLGTHAILHRNIIHLCMNMSGLKKFGHIVEKRWGARGFAKIAACALAANTATAILFEDHSRKSLGISGVVFALAGASHLTKPKEGIEIDPTCKAFWIDQIIFGSIMQSIGFNIDHKAHLSGYMAGMAFSYLAV